MDSCFCIVKDLKGLLKHLLLQVSLFPEIFSIMDSVWRPRGPGNGINEGKRPSGRPRSCADRAWISAGTDELRSLLEVGVYAERRTSLLPCWKKA